jgi:3-methyladenine DNA glycosylase AlkD
MEKEAVNRKRQLDGILKELKSLSHPEALAGMGRFGINTKKAYGISIPELRRMAKEIGMDHVIALKLWESGIHEARILAGMIDDPGKVSDRQMEKWVKDFDSWDVCDQVCSNLFDKTEVAYQKAIDWSGRRDEFVKRAGFVLMAALAVHDKDRKDRDFEKLLPIIIRESGDARNFVRKAVNWALRQIGKRSHRLNEISIKTAREVKKMDSKAGRWIASDALQELTSEAVQKRLSR